MVARTEPGPDGSDLLLKVPGPMEIEITHTGLGVSRTLKFVPKLFGMSLEMPESPNSASWQLDPECSFGARGGSTPRSYQFAWLLAPEKPVCRMFPEWNARLRVFPISVLVMKWLQRQRTICRPRLSRQPALYRGRGW